MKLKILEVSPYFFIRLCTYGSGAVRVAGNKLPEDCRFVRSFTNDASGWGRISLVLESESFEKVREGDPIPKLEDPTFERIE